MMVLGVVVVAVPALMIWGFAGRPIDPETVTSPPTTAAVEATVVSEATTATPHTIESQASTTTMVTEPIGNWVPIPDGPWAHPSTVRAWTGNELIVFPQYRPGLDTPAAGLAYDPDTQEWRMLTPPPELRGHPAVVWTGTRLLIWGGTVDDDGVEGFTLSNTGFSYDPATDAWAALPAAPLDPQTYPFHVWTGQELIVWGGSVYSQDCCFTGTTSGAAYNPDTGRWRLLSDSPLGSRNPGVGVWTGTEMIIGGNGDQTDGDATWAAYDPVSDLWRRLPDPPVRAGDVYRGVWTGSEVIFAQDGGDRDTVPQSRLYAFDPATDTWREPAAPGQSVYQTASVWTGEYILFWGETGYDENDPVTSLAYDPATDTWTPLSPSPLSDRFAQSSVIGPNTVLIWGGADYAGGGFSDGAILFLEG
jgi:hypothetical protein